MVDFKNKDTDNITHHITCKHWRRKHKNLGGGTGVVFARAPGLRKYKVARTTPKKADERGGGGGGLPPIFFFRTISGHQLHYWVGVPSVHNTDLRGDKQKKTTTTTEI